MADFDPNDHMAHSASPSARLATRDELYGPSRPSAPLTDDEVAVLVAPAAPLSAEDDGIDMELLGELCREEPDEATKREVASMMDGIRSVDDSPLSDPEYPALMAEALRQAKDGD